MPPFPKPPFAYNNVVDAQGTVLREYEPSPAKRPGQATVGCLPRKGIATSYFGGDLVTQFTSVLGDFDPIQAQPD